VDEAAAGDKQPYKVKLAFTSRDSQALEAAMAATRDALQVFELPG